MQTYGVHINGYTVKPDGSYMWIARRSKVSIPCAETYSLHAACSAVAKANGIQDMHACLLLCISRPFFRFCNRTDTTLQDPICRAGMTWPCMQDKPTFPGKLDHIVAGGQPFGIRYTRR